MIGEATPEPERLRAGAALWRPKRHPCITSFGSRLTAGGTGNSLTLGDNDRSIFVAASGQILMAANILSQPDGSRENQLMQKRRRALARQRSAVVATYAIRGIEG